jgi:hypothetical protein
MRSSVSPRIRVPERPVCRVCAHYAVACTCAPGAQWIETPLCWRCDAEVSSCCCEDGFHPFERFLELEMRAAAYEAAAQGQE